ncbi:NADH-quinone oxidoreductase subunit G [uncultured Nocardioides sp.]|uniref:NADH-quinone oxidoreductase subunit G n=1 Tax=uncultured Nocardioides sp. TaxID=198441 RepID=UPI0025F47DD6|nr:NADH-quinone oxidoreductase subunit G [uncultured Nocardioides sp.]
MTTTPSKTDLVTLTIDGVSVSVPPGTLVIRAAEQVGVQIPRFCDHPLLAPVGACRQCLVEVAMPGPDGSMRQMQGPPGRMKPQASCTLVATEGMEVKTQISSAGADKAQQGIMEFLLVNHPLDCPVCDKGGECPLQNQAMSNGRGESRFDGVKRTFPKPINISAQVLLDRERCVLCARCTRFSEEIAGDPFIALIERGALQQVGIYEKEPFESYFSGNTIQICPVGALTSADYRFRSRPFDLVSSPSVAEHDACGSAIRVDHRRGKVMRRLAGNDPEVNEEWITDKDRFAFGYSRAADRITYPMVRDDQSGELRPASWPEAFTVAARGLRAAGAGAVLTGGRVTAEDAYAYAKFARVALGTNDIDFRSRPLSAEETSFLGAHVALSGGVTYADLEQASVVVLAGFEPEDEAGPVFLRLRKATRGRTRVVSVAPYTSRGLAKLDGRLVRTVPGEEAAALAALADDGVVALDSGGIIMVGERLATSPGAYAAALDLAATTGARLVWVPRRAGDRGAVEAGCLPTLLPGGRPVADAQARVDAAAAWGVASVPEQVGRDADAIVAALLGGEVGGLVIGGVDPDDTRDPAATRAAVAAARFVVALELRETDVTRAADVVLPVAPVFDKAGTFVTWDARTRPFEALLSNPASLPDLRVLSGVAEEMGAPLGFRTVEQVRAEMMAIGPWDGARPVFAQSRPTAAPAGAGTFRLATWKQMVDLGSMQDGVDHLRATARRPVARLGQAAYDDLFGTLDPGAVPQVTVTGDRGAVTLPVVVADLPAGVVWVPANSFGNGVLADLASPGSSVDVKGVRA